MILVLISFFFLCSVTAHDKTFYAANKTTIKSPKYDDVKYPYQVSVRSKLQHLCGGSIVNNRWILTAAFCTKGYRNCALNIVVGSNDLYSNSGKIYNSEYIIYHKHYKPEKFLNSIGMIRVTSNIEFNRSVQPIKLPTEDFTKINYSALFTSWGIKKVDNEMPNYLKDITMKVIDVKKCAMVWKNLSIGKSHLCVLTKHGENSCHGDGGGPLVVDGVQIGISSLFNSCTNGVPSVFTKVYFFMAWIREQLSKF